MPRNGDTTGIRDLREQLAALKKRQEAAEEAAEQTVREVNAGWLAKFVHALDAKTMALVFTLVVSNSGQCSFNKVATKTAVTQGQAALETAWQQDNIALRKRLMACYDRLELHQ
jgi:hypothetical protein